MSGIAIAVVGMRGMGKSYTVKQKIAKVHPDRLMIHDINGEYKDFYTKPLLKFDEFAAKMATVKGMVIVIEEATVFLNNRSFNYDALDTIVRARHAGNIIYLVFHTIQSIPSYIYPLLNYVILLKTADKPEKIEKLGNENIERAFLKLKKADFLIGEKGKKYSPQIEIDLFAVVEDEDNDKGKSKPKEKNSDS